MRKKIFCEALFVISFLFTPFLVDAEVVITEIAWMGTEVSANDEWIELHNNGSSSVDLSGWNISGGDGSPNINLSGTLAPGAYGLIERTDDTSYPGITAIHIFTGALGNEGEDLTLRNGTTVVQNLQYSGGWPAGDVTTKKTMQLLGSSWITAVESAGGPTTATGEEEEETEEGDTDDGGTEEEETEDENTESEESSSSGKSVKAGPVRKVYDDMIFELNFPKRAIVGTPAHFDAQALDFDRTKMFRGTYMFNMGDGTIRTYTKGFNKDQSGFDHTYDHPGTYQVRVKYYLTYFEGVPPEVDETYTVEVSAPTATITKVHADGGIELGNSSGNEIDVSLWKLRDSFGNTFIIPEDTVVLPNKTMVLSQKRTRLSPGNGVALLTPTGVFASSWSNLPDKIVRTASSSAKKDNEDMDGEVLGVLDVVTPTVSAATIEPAREEDAGQQGLIYTLIFIILVLLSVIAVMMLRKSEKPVEEYELIDE